MLSLHPVRVRALCAGGDQPGVLGVRSFGSVEPSDTCYAKSGDLSIAYQVIGQAPLDLVYTGSWTNQIEHAWELPSYRRFLERLASFSRLITFDKRGSGLSDRIAGTPTLEERMDDLRAVLDAVGSERAALLGSSEGGVLSAMFAASYPERTQALVLFSSLARLQRADDYPWGWTCEFFEAVLDYIEHRWAAERWRCHARTRERTSGSGAGTADSSGSSVRPAPNAR